MDPGVDPNTGLIYLRARYYDPTTGQFLSVDPLNALTQQPYSYANDNPINETDPLGLCGGFLDLGCVGDAIVSVSGPVSLAAGGLALIPTPLSPVLGGISAVAAGISSAHEFASGNPVSGVLDVAGAAFGGAGLVSGLNAAASEAASGLARTELGAAGAAAQTDAELAAYGDLAAEYQASRLAANSYGARAASLGFDAFGFGLGSTVNNASAASCTAAG